MVAFNTVQIYPMSGPWGRWWTEGEDTDALARSARAVCERYSECLREKRTQHKVSTLRIFATEVGEPHGGDRYALHTERPYDFEMGHATPPTGFAARPPADRASWTLDVVHDTCIAMAEVRGLDIRAFEQARSHVIDHDLGYNWSSAWKNAPGRRHRARCTYRLTDTGFGEMTVEVRDKAGGIVGETTPQPAWVGYNAFRRSARTFHWLNAESFSVIPFTGLIAEHVSGEFVVGLATDGTLNEGRPPGLPPLFATL
jgi:hypothetical protein